MDLELGDPDHSKCLAVGYLSIDHDSGVRLLVLYDIINFFPAAVQDTGFTTPLAWF
jgi:hypothetical protein